MSLASSSKRDGYCKIKFTMFLAVQKWNLFEIIVGKNTTDSWYSGRLLPGPEASKPHRSRMTAPHEFGHWPCLAERQGPAPVSIPLAPGVLPFGGVEQAIERRLRIFAGDEGANQGVRDGAGRPQGTRCGRTETAAS
jgi:hypothetical protein